LIVDVMCMQNTQLSERGICMSVFSINGRTATAQLRTIYPPELPDALLDAMKAFIEVVYKNNLANGKDTKEQLAEISDRNVELSSAKEINDMLGYVNHKKIERTGIPPVYASVAMSDDDFKNFSALLKRKGIDFSGMMDIKDKELSKKITYILECRRDDFESIKKTVDLFNEEIKLKELYKKITEFEEKGEENLDNKEKIEYQDCLNQQADMVSRYCNDYNDEQVHAMLEKVAGIQTKKGLTSSEALDSETGGHLNRGFSFVFVEVADPSKHIISSAYDDFYNGNPYIKTNFSVFNGKNNSSHPVLKTHDGHFYGREFDYWNRQKADMQKAGGFSDTLIKLKSIEEYKKYMNTVTALNKKKLGFFKVGNVNRALIASTLQKELGDRGLRVEMDPNSELYGKVVSVNGGTELKIDISGLDNMRADYFEAYERVLGAPEGTQERANAQKECNMCLEAYHDCLSDAIWDAESIVIGKQIEYYSKAYDASSSIEEELLNERKRLNSVMACDELREIDEITKGKSEESLSKDEWNEKIGSEAAKVAPNTGEIAYGINRTPTPSNILQEMHKGRI